jgi:phosphinothricin acetyltransferase
MVTVRAATLNDLPALTDLYNHYIVHTSITFDVRPHEPHERRRWFDEHAGTGRHRLLVADDEGGRVVGYASTGRWRPKAAYDTTVESSVYCRAGATGQGIGTRLYEALFAAIADDDVHRIVAGVTLPNPASLALHEHFGFSLVGEFTEVGHKFGRYWNVAWFQRPAGDRA